MSHWKGTVSDKVFYLLIIHLCGVYNDVQGGVEL